MPTKQLISSLLIGLFALSACRKNDDPVRTTCFLAGRAIDAESSVVVRGNSLSLSLTYRDPQGLGSFDATLSRVPLATGQFVVSDSIPLAPTVLLSYPGGDVAEDDFVPLGQAPQFVEITNVDREKQRVKGSFRVKMVLLDLYPPKATTLPDTLVFECPAFDLRWE